MIQYPNQSHVMMYRNSNSYRWYYGHNYRESAWRIQGCEHEWCLVNSFWNTDYITNCY